MRRRARQTDSQNRHFLPGMAATRTSGSTTNARTSFRIIINRTPGVLAICRITTPSTASSQAAIRWPRYPPALARESIPRAGSHFRSRQQSWGAHGQTVREREPTLWRSHGASPGRPAARGAPTRHARNAPKMIP
jgi:hypothetical protein